MNRYFPTEHILVIAVVLMLSARIAAQPSAVLLLQYPLVDHPVYSYLERMQTSGSISLLSSTRPYLGHVHHSVFFGEQVRLTREDRRYTSEGTAAVRILGYDIKRNRISGWTKLRRRAGLEENQAQWLYRGGFHFAAWQYDTTLAVAIQPVYGLEFIETDDERGTISRFTAGARVEGGYARRLHFMVDFRDHTETGNGPYASRSQLFEDRWAAVDLKSGNSTSYDISESFLQYYGRDLSLTAGRGRFFWGPARHGSLFLNAQMPPFDYARFDAVLDNQKSQAIYYTFLHGWLQSQIPAETLYVNPGGRPRTLSAQKYFSAQRLEVRPRADLLFGFSQGVIYGDRGVQLGYLTPLNFLYSVQHSNDDKDNMLLAFDANWRPVHGVRVYGEAFFDDIVVSALTTSSGSNKSAYTAGVQLAGVQGFLKSFDGGIEYTKIRPFVYSHIFAVNTHTHWTSPIGYTLEPNSEFFTADVQGTFYPVQIGLHFSRQNHGENTAEQNVGGNIYEPLFDSSQNNLYPFLDGNLVRTTRMGVSAEWETLPNLRLRAAATHVKTTGQSDRFEWRGGLGWNL